MQKRTTEKKTDKKKNKKKKKKKKKASAGSRVEAKVGKGARMQRRRKRKNGRKLKRKRGRVWRARSNFLLGFLSAGKHGCIIGSSSRSPEKEQPEEREDSFCRNGREETQMRRKSGASCNSAGGSRLQSTPQRR